MNPRAAKIVMDRTEALAQMTDEPGRLTRTFCSPAMRRANELTASWMREAGMAVRQDAVGNLIGRYPALDPKPQTLILGSHLDTVRDAGKFDGALGVLCAIACVQQLHDQKITLPFALEVVAFADEEGVRYHSTYLGSRALAGTFALADLDRVDSEGVTMSEAIRQFGGNPGALATLRIDPDQTLGYVEIHIEQGPVLEKENLAVGVVTAFAGQTRISISLAGHAGHAGTTPMALRRDALCAAAELVLAFESIARAHSGAVATVGEMKVGPGASNVVPGVVTLSLDLRHPKDVVRQQICREMRDRAQTLAAARNVAIAWTVVHETGAVECDERLSNLLEEAVKRSQKKSLRLPSGAGHDAAAMAAITPVAMLFVRCKEGLSHHPDESVAEHDVQVAIEVMGDFVRQLKM